MYLSKELKNTKPIYELDTIRDMFMDNLFEIVNTYFSDKSMFSADDFTFYVLDEHILETNCNNDIFTCIYLEINQPNNYKPDINKKRKLKFKNNNDKYQIPDLYIKLSDIRKGLYDTCVKHFDNSNIIWQDKYSVCIKSNVLLEDNSTINCYFKIIPGFTYYNKNNIRGIVYYSNNDVQIEYPESFINNFNKKNKQTKDMFRQIILIFKNILLKDKNISRLPSEIIETLIYNVPNNMLKSDDISSMINIINFIRNHPFKEYKTIDEQDFAFSSLYRSMSVFYTKHILKIIEKYLLKNQK